MRSAHRTPDAVAEYAKTRASAGCASSSAARGCRRTTGAVAAHTDLPVIGVPLRSSLSVLDGLDALLAIAQMPPGVPVAAVGVDNAKNAGALALRILRERVLPTMFVTTAGTGMAVARAPSAWTSAWCAAFGRSRSRSSPCPASSRPRNGRRRWYRPRAIHASCAHSPRHRGVVDLGQHLRVAEPAGYIPRLPRAPDRADSAVERAVVVERVPVHRRAEAVEEVASSGGSFWSTGGCGGGVGERRHLTCPASPLSTSEPARELVRLARPADAGPRRRSAPPGGSCWCRGRAQSTRVEPPGRQRTSSRAHRRAVAL